MMSLPMDFTAAFPSALKKDVEIVQSGLEEFLANFTGEFNVNLSSGTVSIPNRVYLNLPQPELKLSATQKLIMGCVFTRHNDGRVREAYLQNIVHNNEEWICPFVWKLLGEYVIEIVEVVRLNAEDLDLKLYSEFLARNPAFVSLTTQQAISYWDCYYRHGHAHARSFRTFAQYPAYPVFARFGVAVPCVRQSHQVK
jgi:hypothetical protein